MSATYVGDIFVGESQPFGRCFFDIVDAKSVSDQGGCLKVVMRSILHNILVILSKDTQTDTYKNG